MLSSRALNNTAVRLARGLQLFKYSKSVQYFACETRICKSRKSVINGNHSALQSGSNNEVQYVREWILVNWINYFDGGVERISLWRAAVI